MDISDPMSGRVGGWEGEVQARKLNSVIKCMSVVNPV